MAARELQTELAAQAVSLVRQPRLRIDECLAAADETAYIWTLSDDQIQWQSNADALLGVRSIARLASGTAFHLHIGTEHAGARHDVIRASRQRDDGAGVPYRVIYRFMPEGRRTDRSVWIEDQGRWYADAEGRPAIAKGVLRLIDERYQAEERLRALSECDALTGVLNGNRLHGAISSAISEAQVLGEPCVMMLVAINNLAVVNDTFGFAVGDEVIAAVAQRLRRQLRGGDVIGRFSANKFGIIVHNCEADGLQAVQRRLIQAVREKTIETSLCHISASISIGAVALPQHGNTPGVAIGAALDALEEARSVHQDRCVTFSPSAQRTSARRHSIDVANSIVAALQEHRLMVALQPVLDAGTRQTLFHECLLRMQMRDGTIISAGEFIPVAEQLGLARLLDHRVLELAVGLVKTDPSLSISLNVSGLTASDHDWLISLQRLIGDDRGLAARLLIEITETAAIEKIDETVAFVEALKEFGCRVAIDDFGAGYTSFKNLRQLGANMVKIDGTFVRNILNDPADRVFVETLCRLAKCFDMQTVAEWVGDEETAKLLAEIGVDGLQGNFLGEAKLVPGAIDLLQPAIATV